MQTKITYLKAWTVDFVRQLKDVRFFGQIVFVIIVLLISYSGVKAIRLNYDLQKEISTAKQENEIQKLENENLSFENEYYNSKQYLELQARLNFGLASPGEQEIIVPKSVALAAAPVVISSPFSASRIHEPKYQQNIQDWFNYLLHRH